MKIIYSINNEGLAYWNKCKYIIVHHTWSTGTDAANIKYLNKDDYISCHYLVGKNWDVTQLCDENRIAYHCWVSNWLDIKNMNPYCLWIEVNSDWITFTDEQRIATKELIRDMMRRYTIPWYNVLRHKDIAPLRKNDIWDSFWNNQYQSWFKYQDSLTLNNMTELEVKTINAIIAVNSAAWLVAWDLELKGKLEEMNKYLRELLIKFK